MPAEKIRFATLRLIGYGETCVLPGSNQRCLGIPPASDKYVDADFAAQAAGQDTIRADSRTLPIFKAPAACACGSCGGGLTLSAKPAGAYVKNTDKQIRNGHISFHYGCHT